MNSERAITGLTARQKAVHKIKSCVSTLARCVRWALFATIVFVVSSCHEKTNGQAQADANEKAAAMADSLDKPKVDIKVNRHYDDQGNLIGFDSTYSSYYSNIKGDTGKMDSLMRGFDMFFNRNHSSFFNKQFDPLFFRDSLRYPDFFHKDFFLKRYELNDWYFRDVMKRMDSIKNKFYEESARNKNSKDL